MTVARWILGLGILLVGCAEAPVPEPPAVSVAIADTLPDRRVAVTFDDLPAVAVPSGTNCDREALLDFTAQVLDEIGDVPTVGLVTEGQVCAALRNDVLPDLLTEWLDAGHDLGNHTFGHLDLNTTSVADYQQTIIEGETVTKRLLEERGQRLRYFRYPYLRSGNTAEKKEAIEAFLTERGYTNAPVTIDNDEWIFAHTYRRAAERGDADLMERIGTAYVAFMDSVTAHFEAWSVEVLGYKPPQVLLLHANLLNADYFAEVAAMLERRGYRFVTLDEALTDPAYARPDTYVGTRGLSWLHRWAIGDGKEPAMEPSAPTWVQTLYQDG